MCDRPYPRGPKAVVTSAFNPVGEMESDKKTDSPAKPNPSNTPNCSDHSFCSPLSPKEIVNKHSETKVRVFQGYTFIQ